MGGVGTVGAGADNDIGHPRVRNGKPCSAAGEMDMTWPFPKLGQSLALPAYVCKTNKTSYRQFVVRKVSNDQCRVWRTV